MMWVRLPLASPITGKSMKTLLFWFVVVLVIGYFFFTPAEKTQVNSAAHTIYQTYYYHFF
jgi:hypothetical protein